MQTKPETGGRNRVLKAGFAVAALLLVVMLPPVQTQAARWLLADLALADIEFELLWMGPWGAQLRNLRVLAPGLELRATELEVDFASWSSLLGLKLDIESISGLDIDLSVDMAAPPGPVPTADAGGARPVTTPFAGLAPLMTLPNWLVLRSLTATGSMRLLAANQLDYNGPWQLQLADLRPGNQATLTIDTSLGASRDEALLAAMRIEAHAVLEVAADGSIVSTTLSLHANPERADAALDVINDVALDATLSLDLSEYRETYSLFVDGSGLFIDGAGAARLLDIDAVFQPAARQLDARWSARLPPGLVAAFMQGDVAADLEGTSKGSAGIELAVPMLQLESTTQLQGEGWEAFDARLDGLGQLQLSAHIRAAGWASQWTARQFDLNLKVADGREVLHVNALQPTRFNFDSSRAVPERWGEPALRLGVDELPLAWLGAFDPARVFESGTLSGALEIIPVRPGHIRLETKEPIRATALQLTTGQRGPLPVLDITVVPHVELEDGSLQARIDSLTLVSETGLRVNFKGNARSSAELWPAIDFEGGVAVRAPVLQRNVRGLDALRGAVKVQLDLGRQVLGIRSVGLDARSIRNTTLMSLQLTGDAPLELTWPDWTPNWDGYQPQQLVLRLAGLPIEWLSPYIPEIDIQSGALYGELRAVARRGEGFRLEASKPFEVRGLVPYYRGSRMARELSVELSPVVALSNKRGSIELKDISIRSLSGDRLDGQLTLLLERDGRRRIDMNLSIDGFFPTAVDRTTKLGAMSWRQTGAIDLASGAIEVSDLALSLSDAAGTRFMEVDSLRPFAIASDPLRFSVVPGPAEVLRAVVTPLELQRLIPELGELKLEGTLPQGEFFGRIDGAGRIVIAADTPLHFRDVSVRWDDALLFERLTVGLNYEVAYSASGLEARTVRLRANNQLGERLGEVSLQAVAPLTAKKTLQSLDVSLRSALAPLATQALMDGLPKLLGGELSLDFSVVNNRAPVLRARGVLKNATVEALGTLPDLDIALALDGIRGERLALKLPFRMRSQRGVSDLDFVGEVVNSKKLIHFDASLVGEQFIVPDLRMFYDFLVPPEASGPETMPTETTTGTPATGTTASEKAPRKRISRSAVKQLRQRRDQAPFWSDRLSGAASINIANLRFPAYAAENIRGQLQVTPTEISLSGIEASLLDAQLATAGTIRYHGDRPEPYDMRFDLELTDLQLGELLRSEDPSAPPVVEGLFSLTTELAASGRNALDLGLASQGSIHLSGRDGVFRGLAPRGGASTAAGVVGVLSLSKELRAIGRILDQLENLSFSQLNVSLLRDTPQRVRVEDLLLVSPQLRLEGDGHVTLRRQGPLLMSPLQAKVLLATRGDMSILFDGMGLLDKDADSDGYRALNRPISIAGTLSEPDTSDLWRMLDEAAENARGLFGLGLRGINSKLKKGRAKAVAE